MTSAYFYKHNKLNLDSAEILENWKEFPGEWYEGGVYTSVGWEPIYSPKEVGKTGYLVRYRHDQSLGRKVVRRVERTTLLFNEIKDMKV